MMVHHHSLSLVQMATSRFRKSPAGLPSCWGCLRSFSAQSNHTKRQSSSKGNSLSSIQEKYAEKLQQKLNEKGLSNLEELKKLSQDKIETDRAQQRKIYEDLIKTAYERIEDANHNRKQERQQNQGKTSSVISKKMKTYSSPIKPLDSIIDVNKLASESPGEIMKLWTAYHLSTSNPPRLGAVVPTRSYQEMIKLAKKYPSFVIPLAKSYTATPPLDQANPKDAAAFEMQYLQWDFVQPPGGTHVSELLKPRQSFTPSTLPPTVVMYTPLAEYKLKQTFTQPSLILTHYTDLANSHGIVLMRGDITPSNGSIDGKLTAIEAQLLVLRLQQFYHDDLKENMEDSIFGKRKSMLRQFHEKPDDFQISKLLELVQDL